MQYRFARFLFLAVVLISASLPALSGDTSYFEVDREFYPYYPSLIKWNKSNAGFTAPDICGGCHPQQFEEWTGSVHALAFQDPIYQGELNKGFKAVGHDVTRQCEGCHSPAGVVTGEIKGPGLTGLSPMALAGVSCDICHSVSGVTHWQTPTHEPENGSFILTPGIETKEGVKLIKRGPRKPSDGCGGGFHECAESPLHLRAELCASCHQVYHYDSHFPIEATYLEWKHGPYAQKGILCQDCHMVEIEQFIKTADSLQKPERGQYRHYFSGANYLLYYLAEAAAQKAGDKKLAENAKRKFEMAVARLKAAAEIEIAPVYLNGALSEVRVRVKNIRAGHNLPTSLTNVREMWLEVTGKDAGGNTVLASGGLDSPGILTPGTRVFNSDGMGPDFHFAIDPWVVTAFSRHDTIPPRGYRDVYFGVGPVKKQGTIMIDARLRYRQADQKVASKLLDEVPKDIDLLAIYGIKYVPALPIVEMAVKQATFKSREAPKQRP
ncbi:MAG TPA: cytochrome c family protein [Nitrospirota bacterium]|nr:cytochrome c family protein [Nitrospirota bacterium]